MGKGEFVQDRLVESSFGYVDILITEEQANDPEYRGSKSQFNLGFLPPEQVPSYFCRECGQRFDKPPEIEVSVDELGFTRVGYKCESGHWVYYSHLENPEGIDPKYITRDATGEWITPTPEMIEEELEKARERAEKGEGRSMEVGLHLSNLNQALKWGEKIGYDTEEREQEIRAVYREAYLRRLSENLPEVVRDIKKMNYGFAVRELDDHEISAWEGTGLYEFFGSLYEALPHIDLPDDPELMQDVLRILEAYRKMPEDRIRMLKEKRAKIIEETDNSLYHNRRALEERTDYNESFVERSGLSKEQVQSVREDPLDTFPGAYDHDEGTVQPDAGEQEPLPF